MQKIKYITNRDLLAELQRSKATFCHFTAPEYVRYDAVVTNIDHLTPELLVATLETKMARLAKAQTLPENPLTTRDVVFRVMTDTHLPEELDEKRRKKSSAGGWVPRTNFPPFQHYVLHEDVLTEVGRSHWRGDLESGQFSIHHGKMSNQLANMLFVLVEQYSRRANWRAYSYLSEMKGQALVQLSQVGLQFDESRSDNPFAWYTQIVKNSFRRILLLERRNQDIRDDLLIMAGAMPSYTRQVEDEADQRVEKSAEAGGVIEQPKKRGRRPKPKETA